MGAEFSLGAAPGPGVVHSFSQWHGAAGPWLAAQAVGRWQRPILAIVNNARELDAWVREWRFFAPQLGEALVFPDRDILPYDRLSPPAEATATRLATLAALPRWRGICVTSVAAALQKLPPASFLDQHALVLRRGDQLEPEHFRQRLVDAGYRVVAEVSEPGELAWRGGIIDLFPSGSALPYRIELFDREVESIRSFDPESQRSLAPVVEVSTLPARELPVDEGALQAFRARFRARFSGDPQRAEIYRRASQGAVPAGAEHYLPLFFDTPGKLWDFLPRDAILLTPPGLAEALAQVRADWQERYEEHRHDPSHPLLSPEELLWDSATWQAGLAARGRLAADTGSTAQPLPLAPPPSLQADLDQPLAGLDTFLTGLPGGARALIAAESPGRAEALAEHLRQHGHTPERCADWPSFLRTESPIALAVAPLERGLLEMRGGRVQRALISEAQIFGDRIFAQRRSRSARRRSQEHLIRDLGELQAGDAVTHEDYGIGRFRGLETPFVAAGDVNEYVVLEYAGGDLVYVPADHLDRIARYIGNGVDEPELTRLGSRSWEKAKARARAKAVDAASELLDIYARRAARPGRAFPPPDERYWDFVSRFPFEETPDQQAAIDAVIADMTRTQPMDRLICGDVGFGKTEVALRAAFLAAASGAQVAVLVPTTLLAQQHFENFRDRFAGLPIRVAVLSRFQNARERREILAQLASGAIRIVIGTHRLLSRDVQFCDLGLLILDEEHRFGVRQKEQIKALRSEVDVLTLTATPIPRTLNLSLAGLRDLSIIATPPERRQPVRTFVQVFSEDLVREACQRELHRGGQIYYLHNEVRDIERSAATLRRLVPEARLRVAHGQMPEAELESVMLDFYHQRFDILLCTTIIESGIDNPSANTMLIDRADRFGLAQLHQLRGRVGRSHQRAYCYLFTPDPRAMTEDARRRLDAIQSLEDLGVGFALASHDLEIRGAGELLGDAQSGHMEEVGFTLFMEWLNEAVDAIRAGRDPQSLAESRAEGPRIHLNIAALIPASYIGDVHLRLQFYKRLARIRKIDEIGELMVELIDRFGPIPAELRALLCQTHLRLVAQEMGVLAIDAGPAGARLEFAKTHRVAPEKVIARLQQNPSEFRLEGEQILRWRRDLPEGEARCEATLTLIQSLRRTP
ncbi:transcription-repair coupling factor [Acidithiobacillus caldus]